MIADGFQKRVTHNLVISFVVLIALVLTPKESLAAEDLDMGRKQYYKICSKCHGQIEEQAAQSNRGYAMFAVMAPIGPNLSTIYGRPAGTFEGFRYSNAFREVAKTIVWDEQQLDTYLTNSQAMVQGSYMFLKVKQPERGQIIRFLKTYAKYPGKTQ